MPRSVAKSLRTNLSSDGWITIPFAPRVLCKWMNSPGLSRFICGVAAGSLLVNPCNAAGVACRKVLSWQPVPRYRILYRMRDRCVEFSLRESYMIISWLLLYGWNMNPVKMTLAHESRSLSVIHLTASSWTRATRRGCTTSTMCS